MKNMCLYHFKKASYSRKTDFYINLVTTKTRLTPYYVCLIIIIVYNWRKSVDRKSILGCFHYILLLWWLVFKRSVHMELNLSH